MQITNQYAAHLDLEAADLVTFSEEILNGKVHFLCSIVNITFEKIITFSSLSLPFTKFVFIFSMYEQQL